jgi:hypothetical protein
MRWKGWGPAGVGGGEAPGWGMRGGEVDRAGGCGGAAPAVVCARPVWSPSHAARRTGCAPVRSLPPAPLPQGQEAVRLARSSGVKMAFGSDLLGPLHKHQVPGGAPPASASRTHSGCLWCAAGRGAPPEGRGHFLLSGRLLLASCKGLSPPSPPPPHPPQSEEFRLRAEAGVPAEELVEAATSRCAELFSEAVRRAGGGGGLLCGAARPGPRPARKRRGRVAR